MRLVQLCTMRLHSVATQAWRMRLCWSTVAKYLKYLYAISKHLMMVFLIMNSWVSWSLYSLMRSRFLDALVVPVEASKVLTGFLPAPGSFHPA